MAQQTNKQSSNHSFYKEAKKSFYGSEGFSKEKGWKLTKKFTKWALYGFLTITTLWGCVNEFIIKTGNQIGTGVEFYSSSSEVVPNMFASDTEMIWEATGQQSDEEYEVAGKIPYDSSKPSDKQESNAVSEWEGTELKPFDMVTINSNFGKTPDPDDETDNDIDTTSLFVPVSESQNTGQVITPSQYGIYNLTQLNNNKVKATIGDNSSVESLYLDPSYSSSTLPEGLQTKSTDEQPIPIEEEITTWDSFYVDKLEQGELYDPNNPNNSTDDDYLLSSETIGEGNEISFKDEKTSKYFSVSWVESKEDVDGNKIPAYKKIEPKRGWYAKPLDENKPKTCEWQIVADTTLTFPPLFLQPEFVKDENGKPTDKVKSKVSKETIDTVATNTAISIVNEVAFYTGEEISIGTTLQELLGLVSEDDIPMLQIKEANGGTYQQFYESIDSKDINLGWTIGDIAINSTWSYIEQNSAANGWNSKYNFYDIQGKDKIDILDSDYSANYDKLLTSKEAEESNGEVSFGQAYVVSGVTSKQPTIPTYDALYTMQNLRSANWDNKDIKNLRKDKKLNDIYVDPLAQFAGWGLLDENGNLQIVANDDPEKTEDYYIIQQVYDDPNVNFYDNDTEKYVYDQNEAVYGKYGYLTEEDYYAALEPIFAMDRTDGVADGTDPPTDSRYGNNKTVDAHFDQMMFEYAKGTEGKGGNPETYSAYFESTLKTIIYAENGVNTKEEGINKKEYEIAYATPVLGVDTNTQIGPKSSDYKDDPDEVKRGTTTPVAWTNDPINKTALDSSLYNSNSKGIDEGNTSRGIFAGWSDWGWAWNIKFGPLYGLFLFPISQIALFVQHVIFPFHIFGAWGVLLGVFFIVFFLRGVGTLMSFKSTSNQQKMQEVQVEVAKINAKYEKYGDNKQMKQRKQMEVMALYRKKEINPLGSFGTIFITMPIFISMWILISAIPVYKVAAIGKFSFSVSALSGIFSSLFILYILVGISVGLMQGISAKLPGWLSQKRKGIKQVTEAEKKAQKKQNKTQNIMVGVFIVIGLTVPVLLAFYWISSAIFTICLELGRHEYQIKKGKKVKQEK